MHSGLCDVTACQLLGHVLVGGEVGGTLIRWYKKPPRTAIT